jgi:hypothetical protein
MKVSSLVAFVLPASLALGAAIPTRLVQRQTSGAFDAVAHDLVRFKVDLALLQASVASYFGPANLPAAKRVIDNLNALEATIEQATDDANTYASSALTTADREATSQQIVSATNSVAPAVRTCVDTLISKRDDLEAGPFDAFAGNILIISNLRTILNDVNDLEDALIDAVSGDQIANLQQAFVPILYDINRAYNYYSGF